MTVKKGVEWEMPSTNDAPVPRFETDQQLHEFVNSSFSPNGQKLRVSVGVNSSLGRTVGSPNLEARYEVSLDIARIDLEVRHIYLVAYAKCQSMFGSSAMFLMNSQWMGEYNIANHGHPNDGRLDMFVFDNLGIWERRKIYARMKTGSHTPNPHLKESRSVGETFEFGSSRRLVVDGVNYEKTRSLKFEVIPDAITLVL